MKTILEADGKNAARATVSLSARRLVSVAQLNKAEEIASDDDIASLGVDFVDLLLARWALVRKVQARRAGSINELRLWMAMMTPESLRQEADSYVTPSRNAVPMLIEGMTTLNVCGWCLYADGGARSESLSVPVCRLLPRCNDESSHSESQRGFLHQCDFLADDTESARIIQTSQEYLASQLLSVRRAYKEAGWAINHLSEIRQRATCCPLASSLRSVTWFKSGEAVKYLLRDGEGVRFIDATVSYVTGGSVLLDSLHYCDVVSPFLLKIQEWHSLRDQPEFRRLWCQNIPCDDEARQVESALVSA